ncbi:hypothetical protein V8E53_014001 [Lactarius tabidus]
MRDSAPCTSSADVTRLLVQVQARSGRYGAGVCLRPVRRGAWLPKVGTRKCSFGASRTRDATGRTQGPITPVALHVGRPAADRVGRFCCEHQLPPSSRWRAYRIDATLCTLLSVRFGRCASNAKLLGISASKLSGGGPCIASHRRFARNHQRSPFVHLRVAAYLFELLFLWLLLPFTRSKRVSFSSAKSETKVTAPKVFFAGVRAGGGGCPNQSNIRKCGEKRFLFSPGHALPCHAHRKTGSIGSRPVYLPCARRAVTLLPKQNNRRVSQT